MKTSTFKLAERFGALATREAGACARQEIVAALASGDRVELDFQLAVATPSFADECVGQLVAAVGATQFRERVRLSNVLDELRPLLRHVVIRRAQVAA